MKRKPIVAAVSAALGVTVLSSAACAGSTVESVEFIGMSAPATVEEKSDAYTKAQVIYRYTNGKSTTYDLKYHQVTGTTERVNELASTQWLLVAAVLALFGVYTKVSN